MGGIFDYIDNISNTIKDNYEHIYVREQIDGKWGSYSLKDLPQDLAIKHICRFFKEMRVPVFIITGTTGHSKINSTLEEVVYRLVDRRMPVYRIMADGREQKILSTDKNIKEINDLIAKNTLTDAILWDKFGE